ncbi:hypothetical protein NBG4_120053 [Candidatus Sulfobium mesophilum]|uniref:Uncharacterized protein n=1 Tax=Candidatus Sulfobium mesophilum TaxID=2016548 RepID=A0A2U3QEK8_9BACT|nr:hypothetical protein NBG4_120053 [Candidatus Sulfobium mesophilum]
MIAISLIARAACANMTANGAEIIRLKAT